MKMALLLKKAKQQKLSLMTISLIAGGMIAVAGCVTGPDEKKPQQAYEDNNLQLELKRELDEFKPEDAENDSQRIEVYKTRILIIRKHLPGLDRKNRKSLEQDINDYDAEIERLEDIINFKKVKKDLDEKLKDRKLSATDKRKFIREFIDQHTRYENDYNRYFGNLNAEYASLEIHETWESKSREIDECCKFRPDSASDSTTKEKIRKNRRQCQKLLDSLSLFDKSITLIIKAREAKKKLEEQIKYLDGIVKITTLKDVEAAEEKYKNDPSKENYRQLKKIIADFYNSDYDKKDKDKNSVKEKETKSVADWETRDEIIKSWETLKSSPTQDNWIRFDRAINNRIRIYAKPETIDKYLGYHSYINVKRNVTIEFIEVDHLEKLNTASGEKRVIFDCQTGPKEWLDFKFTPQDENRYLWKSGMGYRHINEKSNFSHSVNIDSSGNLEFSIYSIGDWDFGAGRRLGNRGDMVIPKIEILVHLAYEKEYVREVNVVKAEDGNEDIETTVCLKFTKI